MSKRRELESSGSGSREQSAHEQTTTSYHFEFPEFGREFTIDIPFTLQEIELMRQCEEIVAQLSGEATRASGWQRDVYLDYRPLWGHGLKDRTRAIDKLRSLRLLIQNNSKLAETNSAFSQFSHKIMPVLDKFFDLVSQ